METSSKVLVETSPSCSGYVYRKTFTTFKTFSLQIYNVPRQVWGYKNVLNTKQNVTKTCLFSLLHVSKMKFKGSGRFQNVTLLGLRTRLKHVLPGNVIVTFR